MSKRDRYIPWIIVGFTALILATVGRFVAIGNSADAGTANLVFVIVLGGILLAYFLFLEVFEPLFKLLAKRIKVKPRYRPGLPEDSILRGKIESFCRYSNEVLSGYVSEEELKFLHIYIRQYAEGNMGGITQQIKTTSLDNFDLYHYGWNIWNHFDVTKQPETADWLINVFAAMEGSPRDIYKKFKHNERATYKIPIEPNIK